MKTHADKTQENKSQSVANGESCRQSGGEATFLLEDNRPEAIAQRKLQEMADTRPEAKRIHQLQLIANKNNTQLPSRLADRISLSHDTPFSSASHNLTAQLTKYDADDLNNAGEFLDTEDKENVFKWFEDQCVNEDLSTVRTLKPGLLEEIRDKVREKYYDDRNDKIGEFVQEAITLRDSNKVESFGGGRITEQDEKEREAQDHATLKEKYHSSENVQSLELIMSSRKSENIHVLYRGCGLGQALQIINNKSFGGMKLEEGGSLMRPGEHEFEQLAGQQGQKGGNAVKQYLNEWTETPSVAKNFGQNTCVLVCLITTKEKPFLKFTSAADEEERSGEDGVKGDARLALKAVAIYSIVAQPLFFKPTNAS